MIKLYQFPPAFGLPNPSPFCMKVETYLRMANIPYEVAPFNPRQAPRGKAPYIEHEGELISDSSLILEHLKEHYGDTLDAKLTTLQRAQGHIIRRMLEEHTYWVEIYVRWCDDEGWPTMKAMFGPQVPALVRPMVVPMVRRGVNKSIHAHGLGRHERDEIFARGIQDVDAVSELLGDHDFLLGDQPSSFDATGYAFLAQVLDVPFDNAYHAHCRKLPNIVDYVARMNGRYFGDWSPPEA